MFKDFKTNVKFVLLDNLGRLIFLGHNKPRGKGLSGPAGATPAYNGFHSWGIAGSRLCAPRTR